MTYIIEGTWTGYGSGRDKIVYREYTTSKKRVEDVRKLHAIRFTDGTMLNLAVYENRLPELTGYASLIDDCIRQGVSSVAGLR